MHSNSGDNPLQEPIDVPDDARDRKTELAEMWPHLKNRDNLGELWADVARPRH